MQKCKDKEFLFLLSALSVFSAHIPRPKKVEDMESEDKHLGQSDNTTNLDDKMVVFTADNGKPFKMEPSVLALLLFNISRGISERELKNGEDLNLITKSGFYYTPNTSIVESILNRPSTGVSGEMSMIVIGCDGLYSTQLYINITGMLIFIRFQKTIGWTIWKSINLT